MDRKKEIQKFLTKSGKINAKVKPEQLKPLLEDYQKDAPWVQDMKDILWCEKTGSYNQPVCRFCGNKAYYQRAIHSYRDYCYECTNKHLSKERSKNGTWNKGLTKDKDERVRQYANKQSEYRKTHDLTEAQKEVLDRLIEVGSNREHTEEEYIKQRQTMKERYGVESYLSLVYKQGQQAVVEKYGSYYAGSEEWRKKREEYIAKVRKANLEYNSNDPSYYTLTLPDTQKDDNRFGLMLSTHKGYSSNLKFNDLILPFVWRIFYKKELELWDNPIVRRDVIQNRVAYLHKPESELTPIEILRGFSKSGIHKGFSSFSPMVIKNFISDYNIHSIYDPCGGWGHRMLGAWNIEYWYNDFNPELVDAVRRMFCCYDNNSALKYFTCNDASTFTPHRKFDAVFTCPPYYDTEDYGFEGDSKNLVSGYQEWLNEWWRGVVQRGKEVASLFAYVISTKFADDMNRIVEEEGFHLIGSYQTSIKRKNHLNVSAEEFLYVFSLLT